MFKCERVGVGGLSTQGGSHFIKQYTLWTLTEIAKLTIKNSNLCSMSHAQAHSS